jgi:PAS domain S-box-containing protein
MIQLEKWRGTWRSQYGRLWREIRAYAPWQSRCARKGQGMTERDVKASHLPLLDTVGGEFWEMSPDMLAVASLDGYFTHVNPAWEVVLGYSVHELTSQPFIDLVHPDDVEETMEDYRQFRNNPGRVTLEFENRYRARDGTYRVLQWSARASQDEQLVYCIARDVTVQRESELALTASERKSRLLTEIPDSLLAHSSSMQELMETAVRVLAEDIGDAAVVSLIDDTGALLVPTAYRHVNPAAQEFLGELYRSTTVRVGQGVAGMVAESGEAVFVGDLPEGAIRELITPQFWRYPC